MKRDVLTLFFSPLKSLSNNNIIFPLYLTGDYKQVMAKTRKFMY